MPPETSIIQPLLRYSIAGAVLIEAYCFAEKVCVEELCPACGIGFTWTSVEPTVEQPESRSILTCADCGRVGTRLSRGVSITELDVRESATGVRTIHEDDLALLQRRFIARMAESAMDPLEAVLASHDFLDQLESAIAIMSPLAMHGKWETQTVLTPQL